MKNTQNQTFTSNIQSETSNIQSETSIMAAVVIAVLLVIVTASNYAYESNKRLCDATELMQAHNNESELNVDN